LELYVYFLKVQKTKRNLQTDVQRSEKNVSSDEWKKN